MRAELAARCARPFALACALGVLAAGAPRAHAYCRTTTCDPEMTRCATDRETGCVIEGEPLFWPDACVTVWVEDEPALPGISTETLTSLTQAAFDTWRVADCAPGEPAIDSLVVSALDCAAVGDEIPESAYTNTVRAVTGRWPHAGTFGQIALTTVTFNTVSGEIRAFDVELNAVEQRFTTSDTAVEADLLSTLTHEVGHGLGLAHSDVDAATMYPQTGRSTKLRTLDRDDEAAICDVYRPAGGHELCGLGPNADSAEVCAEVGARVSALTRRAEPSCSTAHGARDGSPSALLALLAACGLLLARRSRRRRRAR